MTALHLLRPRESAGCHELREMPCRTPRRARRCAAARCRSAHGSGQERQKNRGHQNLPPTHGSRSQRSQGRYRGAGTRRGGPASRRPRRKRFAESDVRDFVTLLRQGKMIAAIKLYREKTGVGLAEAKAAVETLAAEQGIQMKGSGCAASSSFAACSAWSRSTSFVECEEIANATGRARMAATKSRSSDCTESTTIPLRSRRTAI